MYVTATGSHAALWLGGQYEIYDTATSKAVAFVQCDAEFMDISYPWMACAPRHRLCIYQAIKTKVGWPSAKLYDVPMDVKGLVFLSQTRLLVVWTANKTQSFWGIWKMRMGKPPTLTTHGRFPTNVELESGSSSYITYRRGEPPVPYTLSLKTNRLAGAVDAIEYLKLRRFSQRRMLDRDSRPDPFYGFEGPYSYAKMTQTMRDGVQIAWEPAGVTIKREGEAKVAHFPGLCALSADNRVLVRRNWTHNPEGVGRDKHVPRFEVVNIARHLKSPPKTKNDLYRRIREDPIFAAIRDILRDAMGTSDHVADNVMFFWK